MTFADRRIDQELAKIARCTCGAWRYEWCRACGYMRPLQRADLIEDVEFLLDTGETLLDVIAARCRLTPNALDRRLERYGRTDLLRRMSGRPNSKKKAAA